MLLHVPGQYNCIRINQKDFHTSGPWKIFLSAYFFFNKQFYTENKVENKIKL